MVRRPLCQSESIEATCRSMSLTTARRCSPPNFTSPASQNFPVASACMRFDRHPQTGIQELAKPGA